MRTVSMSWLKRLVVMSWCAVAGVCAVGALFPVDALAGEGTPIAIKSFSLQTTRTVARPGFTRENWGFVNEAAPFTQAGAHLGGQNEGPDALTANVEIESEFVKHVNKDGKLELEPVPMRDPRDIVVDIPPGMLGNPTAVPRCPLKVVVADEHCPAATQIGEAVLYLFKGNGLAGPIVNVIPEAGQSAEFAIETTAGLNFLLTAHVIHTPVGYGLTVVTNSIPDVFLYRVETSFWGVPASPVHDPERGLFCERVNGEKSAWSCPSTGGEKAGIAEAPFLTMPGDCTAGPEQAVLRMDSWEEPGRVGVNNAYEGYTQSSFTMPGVTGCNLLPFIPGIGLEPETTLADEPDGVGVNVSVPQFEEPERLATPELHSASVTLPLGMSVNPGIVDGIQACEEAGPEGINFSGPESEEVGANGELQLAPGHCPPASTVGEAEALTPLLPEPIMGHVYLARPGCGNPAFGQPPCTNADALDGNLFKLYLELGGKGPVLGKAGVVIKVPGEVQADPATGQLTARFEGFRTGDPPRFEGNPQLPFSELKVRLNPGFRSPVANPAVCGPAVATADFVPWAAPGTTPQGVFMPGLADAAPASLPFGVGGCGTPPGLKPGFVAGTVTPNAGKFSAFTLNVSRLDREQYIKGVQVNTPPGLLGLLASVQLCGEAEGNAGTCPEASKIGTTRVASGAGSHPFEIEGSIYLTTSYRGAPFGLSIVTDAVAGPFDLGKVIVRARIDVDPTTSALTVTTDETGPYALPQIVFGVPLRLQRITVDVNRPGFMFNPTDCRAQQITANIAGSQDTVAHVQTPFAVGGCASLKFEPRFSVSTNGHTSRKAGASLDAKVSYPAGAMGRDANIAYVKVSLPKQLPSFLPTLQKACTAAVFAANPANCPAGSIVGIARASTPLLPVGLTGPAYFVSHGGEAFPSLIVVLQGDGVRVDLVGETFINEKTNITSSTFKTVPDVPVNTFELYLPQGANHALAANTNLCSAASSVKLVKRRLARRVHGRTVHRTIVKRVKGAGIVMPTEFVAQNGAVFRQNTRIAVSGCAKSTAKSARRRAGHARTATDRGTNGRKGR